MLMISREFRGFKIEQRCADSYLNGTAMCRVSKKQVGRFLQDRRTKKVMQDLASALQLDVESLVEEEWIPHPTDKNSVNATPRVWLHPKLAFYIAEIMSPELAAHVASWHYWEDSPEPQPVSKLDFSGCETRLFLGQFYIRRRLSDGYFGGDQISRICYGEGFRMDYEQNDALRLFVHQLAAGLGRPVDELMEWASDTFVWIHPLIAQYLAVDSPCEFGEFLCDWLAHLEQPSEAARQSPSSLHNVLTGGTSPVEYLTRDILAKRFPQASAIDVARIVERFLLLSNSPLRQMDEAIDYVWQHYGITGQRAPYFIKLPMCGSFCFF